MIDAEYILVTKRTKPLKLVPGSAKTSRADATGALSTEAVYDSDGQESARTSPGGRSRTIHARRVGTNRVTAQ